MIIFAFVSIETLPPEHCSLRCPYITVDYDQCTLFRMNLKSEDGRIRRCFECARNEKIMKE